MAQAKHKINFTHRTLDSLECPPLGKRIVYFDTKVQGLNIIVTDRGRKSFYLRKVIQGQSMRLYLGVYPDLSVERAREKAHEILAQIADGKNPHEERKRLKEEPTFSEMFQLFQDRHGKRYKRTSLQDERTYQNHLKKRFGSTKLSQITRHDFQKMMSDIADVNGEYAANKTLAIARTVFNKAIEWGIFYHENPASRVKSYPQKARERFLQKEELPKFLKALNAEPNDDLRDFVWLCLFTGARKSNVMAMRWQEVSLDSGEWRIPLTKNGDSQLLPLIPDAVTLLAERRNRQSLTQIFVFPSHGKTGHMVEPKKAWRSLLRKAEIEDFRIHDLRRTMGSYQAILGIGFNIIAKSLGHKSLAATQIYARLDQDPVREAMSRAVELMKHTGKKNNG